LVSISSIASYKSQKQNWNQGKQILEDPLIAVLCLYHHQSITGDV